MRKNRQTLWIVALTIAVQTLSASAFSAEPFKDTLVQAPELARPGRGSVAGTFSSVSFGPGDLLRGSFTLPLPLETPSSRGALLAPVFPVYSPEGGISEWGMGWQTSLSIQRHRAVGDFLYNDDDQYASPWGVLQKGDDGYWYPQGLKGSVRLRKDEQGWSARLPDGTLHRFNEKQSFKLGIYAWYLTEVNTLLGDRATLSYEKNASGRLFLRTVTYGRRNHAEDSQIEFVFQPVRRKFASYRSGYKLQLDQRISRVVMRTRDALTGTYQERWHYDLSYRDSPLGQAFYLSSVTKTYASGEADPPVSYDYDLGEEQLAKTNFVPIPQLDAYLRYAGDTGLAPDRVTYLDLDQDGLVEFEQAIDQTLFKLTDRGYVGFPLPKPAGAPTSTLCRRDIDPANPPRFLARMGGAQGEPQAVFTYSAAGNDTFIQICDRQGKVLDAFNQPQDFQLTHDNIRLVDLNGDHKPEFLRVFPGGHQVLKNASENGKFSLKASGLRWVTPDTTPLGTWVQDMNGDGLVDLVVRYGAGLVVWYGRGQTMFTPEGEVRQLWSKDGTLITGLQGYGLSFLDANHDGLTDILLTQNAGAWLFINHRDGFLEYDVPALRRIRWDLANPTIQDLSGSGEMEIVYVYERHAHALRLTRPSVGLMTSADDGKGTLLRFDFVRTKPQPGIGQRESVLSKLTVDSAGTTPVSYSFEYDQPVVHSQGRYLIGFNSITRYAPFLVEQHTFDNDDTIAGVLRSAQRTDLRSSALIRFSTISYEERFFHGIRWMRPIRSVDGIQKAGDQGVHSRWTDYLSYAREICPTATETRTSQGTLISETELDEISVLAEAMHCLPKAMSVKDTRPDTDPARIRQGQWLTRNNMGQVTRVTQEGNQGTLVLQDVTYDQDFRIETLSRPGRGTTVINYDPVTGAVQEVTSPDGVKARSLARDSLTDMPREILSDRGEGGELVASYRFDGRERLRKSWQDFGGSSESHPLEELQYAFPTRTTPGSIVQRAVLDATGGIAKQSMSLVSPSGEEIGSAAQVATTAAENSWVMGFVRQTDRNELQESTYHRTPIAREALGDLTFDELYDQTTLLGKLTRTGSGLTQDAVTVLQTRQDLSLVEKRAEGSELWHEGGILSSMLEYGERGSRFVSQFLVDESGLLRWSRDPGGQQTEYRYDALGRLIRVILPGGQQQSMQFDDYGRPALVEREGIGAVQYTYAPVTGLLDGKRFLDRDGQIQREVHFLYDEAGRIIEEKHQLTSSGELLSFRFEYDGGLESPIRGQRGYLTRVKGPEFERTSVSNPEGSLQQQVIRLSQWREVTHDYLYLADGTPRLTRRTTVDIQTGQLMETVEKEMVYDRLGRLEKILVNGTDLVRLTYDAEGKLDSAIFPEDQAVKFLYDPTTKSLKGYTRSSSLFDFGLDWKLNERGLIETESMSFGNDYWDRTYAYDSRGFLETSRDKDQSATYTYTPAGLIATTSDLKDARSVNRTEKELRVGTRSYALDKLGRVIQRDDLQLEYGPDGHLSLATRKGNDRVVQYFYDEAGQRILKRENGRPVAGYLGDTYLTQDGLIEPVKVGGILVGILDRGTFHLLATDPRGTPLADRDGARNLPTPYGLRASGLTYSAALDYVEKGYDADLGTVRMGVRDYDPYLGQFMTADPLYLESLEHCAKNPISCNLYSYARNNPIVFSDPTGLDEKMLGLIAAAKKHGLPSDILEIAHSKVELVTWGMPTTSANNYKSIGPFDSLHFAEDYDLDLSYSGSRGIGVVYHESSHAVMNGVYNSKAIVNRGVEYYSNARLESGDRVTQPVRVLDEAIAGYVQNRTSSYVNLLGTISIASRPENKGVAEKLLQVGVDRYNEANTRFTFGYQQNEKGVPVSVSAAMPAWLRDSIDTVFLENKLPNRVSMDYVHDIMNQTNR